MFNNCDQIKNQHTFCINTIGVLKIRDSSKLSFQSIIIIFCLTEKKNVLQSSMDFPRPEAKKAAKRITLHQLSAFFARLLFK